MKPPRRIRLVAAALGLLSLVILISARILFGDASALDWFILGSLVFGGAIATFLHFSQRSSLTLSDQSGRPEISMHRIPVSGGFAGLIFAVGSCLIFLIGIPALRWFLLGAIVVGSAVGTMLWRWHKSRPVQITDIRDAND